MEEGQELQAQRRRRNLEESLLGRDRLLRRRPPGLPAAQRELGLGPAVRRAFSLKRGELRGRLAPSSGSTETFESDKLVDEEECRTL